MQWRAAQRITSFSEEMFLTYFSELSDTFMPSTLWAKYSMLRSMVDIKHNFNIHDYSRLIAFLKQNGKGFKSKKAQPLSAEQVNQFLREAPDNEFLATKVVLIFGVQGACRRKELCDVLVDHIEDKGNMLLVQIPDTKTGRPRSFVVTKEFYTIYKKYAKLRPTKLATKRFFIGFRNGQCTTQNIGINTFGTMPQKVAKFFKLANPETYTGHSFRKTSTTLLAGSGADLLTIKRHGGWKSSAVAEDYIENSVGNKKRIGQQIASTITSRPSTSKDPEPEIGFSNESAREVPNDVEIKNNTPPKLRPWTPYLRIRKKK